MTYICLYFIHYILYFYIFFFFNDSATTDIYTLSLHDALPIYLMSLKVNDPSPNLQTCKINHCRKILFKLPKICCTRSEEHTSELQSRRDLVCRLLLEKKKKKKKYIKIIKYKYKHLYTHTTY